VKTLPDGLVDPRSINNTRAVSSGPVSQLGMSGLVRAVGAAINLAASFYTVAQDAAIAVLALRRERMHRAFETIEHVRFAVFCHTKCFVVIVSASLALCHEEPSSTYRWRKRRWL